MAYADSAIDYNWEVTAISLDNGLMTIKYTSTDSADGRPAIFKNIYLTDTSQFNDSDIGVNAEEHVGSVVLRWDQILEANAAVPSFDADSVIGLSSSSRYIPDVYTHPGAYNPLTQKVVYTDSSDSDGHYYTGSLVNLSDSEKAEVYAGIQFRVGDVRHALESDGRLDSVVSLLGADSLQTTDTNELVFNNYALSVAFDASITTEIQSLLGLNDSGMAAFLQEASGKEQGAGNPTP